MNATSLRWPALVVLASVVCAGVVTAAEDWRGGGPEGGWVTRLARPYGPLGPLYASTYGGGLWRSGDGGATWAETSSNARDALVWNLTLGEEGTLYAATEDRGMLRLDPGAFDFWLAANAGLNEPVQPFVYTIATHPGDPLRISAASSNGVYTSRSRGNVWPDSLKVITGVTVRDLVVMPELPNTMHAAAKEQLLIASGWEGPLTVIDAPGVSRNGAVVPPFLFDLERWPSTTDSLLVVNFEGELLQLRNRSQLVRIGPELGNGPYARFYQVTVAMAGMVPSIYVGADRGLYCTHNRGQLWRQFDGGLGMAKPEIWAVLVEDPFAGELLLGSFVHGVLRGFADGDWQPTNHGLRANWVRGVDAHAGELLIGTAHGKLFHGTDGEHWTEVTAGLDDVQFAAVHLSRRGAAWLAAGFSGVVRSTDSGASWQPVAMPVGVDRIDRFVESPSHPPGTIHAIGNAGLLVSSDDGATWAQVVGPPSQRPSFAIAAARGSRALAVGFDPPPGTSQLPSLWIGDDEGQWREIELPIGFQGRIRGASFLDAAGQSLAVAASPFGGALVYRIDGLGAEQTPVFTSLEPGLGGRFLFPFDLTGDIAKGTLVLALDADGVFVSEDSGATWREYNDGLISLRAEQIAMDLAPPPGTARRLLLGTFARGAWVRESPGRVAVAVDGPWVEREDDAVLVHARIDAAVRTRLVRESVNGVAVVDESPDGGDLSVRESLSSLRALGGTHVSWVVQVQSDEGWTELARSRRELASLVSPLRNGLLAAAPNPFNPRTSIRWEQDHAGDVSVDLVDLRGRMVRRLIRGQAGPGRHSVPWDGTDEQNRAVASGSYVVRLQIGERTWTERVTLVR